MVMCSALSGRGFNVIDGNLGVDLTLPSHACQMVLHPQNRNYKVFIITKFECAVNIS